MAPLWLTLAPIARSQGDITTGPVMGEFDAGTELLALVIVLAQAACEQFVLSMSSTLTIVTNRVCDRTQAFV